jgi:threonine/homoserine/homoserine lactone efflux protein
VLTTTQLLAFAFAALLLSLAPGPDTFLVIGNTVAGGIKRGFATVLGITAGGTFHVAIFSLGIAQVLAYSPMAFFVVKIAGALYLAWLGVGALRSALRATPPDAHLATGDTNDITPRSFASAFAQGVLTNALNPKIAIFYLAFLPQFMSAGDPVALKSTVLIGIHYAIGGAWLSLVVLAVGRLGRFMTRGSVRRWMDGVLGTVMLAFGVRLALSR